MLAGHAICKDCGNGTMENLINRQFGFDSDENVVCAMCNGSHIDGELYIEGEDTTMGLRPTQAVIKRHLKELSSKYVGVEFRVLYASNGETAILPVNPETDEPEARNPRIFQVKYFWNRMCGYDKIDPKSQFVVFSDSNPFTASYNEAMAKLQKGL